MAATRAFVRGVADTFVDALKMAPSDAKIINLALARQQHAAYVSLLRKLVGSVHVLAPDPRQPDCCFVEDAAVVVPGAALVMTRFGAPSRADEVAPVRAALEAALQVRAAAIAAPGTLEGGDVLRLGRRLLVGLTTRTNAAGAEQLQQALGGHGFTVHPVRVPLGLHLKSALTALDDATLLYSGDDAGRALVPQLQQLPFLERAAFVEVPDALAANVLRTGRHVVAQAGCDDTRALLAGLCRERGLMLHSLPRMTEFAKADGSLTCLSILC